VEQVAKLPRRAVVLIIRLLCGKAPTTIFPRKPAGCVELFSADTPALDGHCVLPLLTFIWRAEVGN
jgi:hypothetical protein